VLRQAEIQSLPKPKKYDLEVLRDWLGREKGGNNFLSGIEDLLWLESETSDLVAVSGRDFDSITRWIAETLVPWLYRSRIFKKFLSVARKNWAWSSGTTRHTSVPRA
jgi:hypothetical protein